MKHVTHRLKRAQEPSMDPYFFGKVHDLVGLYLDPPERVLAFGVVETIELRSPDHRWPTTAGVPHPVGHEGVRAGATTPSAAPEAAGGTVLGFRHRRRRAENLMEFLRRIDREVPLGLDIHLVLDNSATHKARSIRTWLLDHRRFHLHVAPTSSSWPALAERWIAARNTDPGPFARTRTADEILEHLAHLMGDVPDATGRSGGADPFESRLREIDWAGVCGGPDHRAGAGALLPRLLHGLSCAADPASAHWWGVELYETAFHTHSGGYLRPAALMTPFLVTICDANRAAPQAVALTLLAHFAGGFPTTVGECCRGEVLEEWTAEAVRAGSPSYYALLTSPVPQVRAAAFVLLSVLEHAAVRRLSPAERIALPTGVPETSARFRRALDRLAATETDPHVLKRIQEAEIDPLFGTGEAAFGIELDL
ncbi:transposase [Streptomyces sp. NPDC059618]|uniref:transposase n=1 Tax=Streptomyces sp. NPDC059618 TaxID=3346887 RepID=UPI00369880F6